MNGYAIGARKGLMVIGIALLLAPAFVWAADKSAARQPAKKPAQAGRQAVKELCDVSWHTSVDAALKQASGGAKEKPVMVLRVLGDLAGFM